MGHTATAYMAGLRGTPPIKVLMKEMTIDITLDLIRQCKGS